MASKLEKAQQQYEDLLRQLGEKAEMVGAIDKANPRVFKDYRRAKESADDRRLELDFIEGELERLKSQVGQDQSELKEEIARLKDEIKKQEKVLDVRKGKVGPLKTKLAGAEYDFKFVEKGLTDEQRKVEECKEKEEFNKAREREATVKKLKIEMLKRKKALVDLKRSIKEQEGPVKKLTKEVDSLKERAEALEEQLEDSEEGGAGGMLEELMRQKAAKDKELARSERHLLDVLADVGEDFYERRVRHPVLSKYYADLDAVAAAIDELQD